MLRVAVVVLVGCAALLAAQVAAVALLCRGAPDPPPDRPPLRSVPYSSARGA